jgi:radical SAM superfamily enzyme YgiQ (UPF0313 family)
LKVLLVQAHLGRSEILTPTFPIGLCYLATALKQHAVKILDLNFWDFSAALQVLRQEIIAYCPDVVGLSIRNVDTCVRVDIFPYIKSIRPTAQLIKETKPEVKLIVGGSGFSLYPQTIMERIPEFDFGVYQDGEESAPELLERLDAPETVRGIYLRRNGAVSFTGHREPPDFAGLPMPKRDADLIDAQRYLADRPMIGIQTKRGCALECAYCTYPVINGRNVRMCSPQAVVDEIEYLIGLGIRKFYFVDNMFNVPEKHALEICEEILRRKLAVEWWAYYEIGTTSEDLLRLARQAGCLRFEFSPDAATNWGLALLKKGITPQDIERSIAQVRRHKVNAAYNLFLLPSLSDNVLTLARYFKYRRALSGGSKIRLGWIRIEPGTGIYRRALAEGRLTKDSDMLPEHERGLEELFYRHSNRYVDRFMFWLVTFFRARGHY